MINGSIGLFLDSIINRNDVDNILDKITPCKNMTYGKFMLILFHQNLSENKLKSFAKKHSDILFDVHTKFTKNKNFRVGFFINDFDCEIENFRYSYIGDIYKGFQEYQNLLNHIKRRDR